MAIAVLILSRFLIFFIVRFLENLQIYICDGIFNKLKIQLRVICVTTLPCGTLMSENEPQSQTNAVINDKLQGTVITTFKVWWDFQ